MASNDNSVNIAAREAYHHGDLRSALIDAGMHALAGGSVDALSLRALAREAGVSATAVYRHFPDKDALLRALAAAGLDRMAEQQATASKAAAGAGPVAAFCASGAAYVRFAIREPELFRLIWKVAPEGDLLSVPVDESHPAMAGLRRAVDQVAPPSTSAGDRRAIALRCWGLVHGLAMLALDRQVVLDDAEIDRVIAGMVA